MRVICEIPASETLTRALFVEKIVNRIQQEGLDPKQVQACICDSHWEDISILDRASEIRPTGNYERAKLMGIPVSRIPGAATKVYCL